MTPTGSSELMWRPWSVQGLPPAFVTDPMWNPYMWDMVEIKREGSDQTDIVRPGELPPTFNVYGLHWRPWPVISPVFDGP